MHESPAVGKEAVGPLYQNLLRHWNRRDAAGMAGLFAEDGILVGFDGSTAYGRGDIEAHLGPVFGDHPTPRFVGRIRTMRVLGRDVALVQAVAGMVPEGESELHPDLNAVQTVVARREGREWRICLFQSTPAALHGRPEAAERLTEELREVLRAERSPARDAG